MSVTAKKQKAAQAAMMTAETAATLGDAMSKVIAEKGWTLRDVLAAFGDVKAKGLTFRDSRKAIREALEQPTVALSQVDRKALSAVPKAVAADLPELAEDDLLAQADVDDLCRRIKPLRRAQDLIEGRIKGIRRVVYQDLDNRVGPGEAGELTSPKEKYKLARGEATRVMDFDEEVLKERLGEYRWRAVTTRELNPDKLAEALAAGKVPQALWRSITDRVLDEAKLTEAIADRRVTPQDLYDAVTVRQGREGSFLPGPMKEA